MKVGIITEYTEDEVNYGNYLQTYALNYYIRSLMKNAQVETIKIKPSMGNTLRTKKMPINIIIMKAWRRIKGKIYDSRTFPEKEARRIVFREFSENYIPRCKEELKYEDFENQDYDIYIAGSDVVWHQYRYGINRIKFLDFQGKKPFKRISYAASFARDWIPEENRNEIQRCLKRFDAVSVREKSSIQILQSLGIEGGIHALDPTLLLDRQEWEQIEVRPEEMGTEKYAFVYLLGSDIRQYKEIERVCHKEGIKIVTIPFASGQKNKIDRKIGDIRLWRCSPQNWIWLVHHAEYVITDSFHGIVFSTIFRRRFVVVERAGSKIGNRLTDYLKTIAHEDKMIQINRLEYLNDLEWNYDVIEENVKNTRKKSIDFLKISIGAEAG